MRNTLRAPKDMAMLFESVNIGDQVIHLVKPPITKTQLVRYAGASGDFNPLHTDDEAAKAAGFDGVVAHGMLMMGILSQAITASIPRRQLRKVNVRFKGMTRPDAVITVSGTNYRETDRNRSRHRNLFH